MKTLVATSTTAKPIRAIKAKRELTRDTTGSPNWANPKENPKDCRPLAAKVAIQHTLGPLPRGPSPAAPGRAFPAQAGKDSLLPSVPWASCQVGHGAKGLGPWRGDAATRAPAPWHPSTRLLS